jgi:hypothetical protein
MAKHIARKIDRAVDRTGYWYGTLKLIWDHRYEVIGAVAAITTTGWRVWRYIQMIATNVGWWVYPVFFGLLLFAAIGLASTISWVARGIIGRHINYAEDHGDPVINDETLETTAHLPITRPPIKLSSAEFGGITSTLDEIDRFLAGKVNSVISSGKQIGNWRKFIRNNDHSGLMELIVNVRADKDKVAWEMKQILQRQSYNLDKLGLEFDEIPNRLEKWHGPIQELIEVAKLLPNIPNEGHSRDRMMNPKAHDLSKEVGETDNLVMAKRKEIRDTRRAINPA